MERQPQPLLPGLGGKPTGLSYLERRQAVHLSDGFGRSFKYLRLSITDVCNFRCNYCLPDGYRKCAGPGPLSVNELRRAAAAFSDLGVRKIRLTGGEPTTRSDFETIAATIADLPGVDTLALTTNGYRLSRKAQIWRATGINALNVSLDSLDRATFHKITGHDRRDEVLAGVEAALEAGFESVKINVVYMRGINDQEIGDFIALAKRRPVSVRFIELMETGDHAHFFKQHHISTDVIDLQLRRTGWTQQLKAVDAGPSRDFVHPDYKGSIGLIAPYAKDFCKSCNRLRLSSQGNLHLCLFGNFGIPMRQYLEANGQIEDLKLALMRAVTRKEAKHHLAVGLTGQTANLSSIGG